MLHKGGESTHGGLLHTDPPLRTLAYWSTVYLHRGNTEASKHGRINLTGIWNLNANWSKTVHLTKQVHNIQYCNLFTHDMWQGKLFFPPVNSFVLPRRLMAEIGLKAGFYTQWKPSEFLVLLCWFCWCVRCSRNIQRSPWFRGRFVWAHRHGWVDFQEPDEHTHTHAWDDALISIFSLLWGYIFYSFFLSEDRLKSSLFVYLNLKLCAVLWPYGKPRKNWAKWADSTVEF